MHVVLGVHERKLDAGDRGDGREGREARRGAFLRGYVEVRRERDEGGSCEAEHLLAEGGHGHRHLVHLDGRVREEVELHAAEHVDGGADLQGHAGVDHALPSRLAEDTQAHDPKGGSEGSSSE